jgi:hypothetical protein
VYASYMPAPWPISAAELTAQHCVFGVDRVAGRPDVTEFKKRARWQQAWWRQRHSLPLGTHSSGNPPTLKPNGSKIEESAARSTDANFLSAAIRTAVEERMANPQPRQTLDELRLRTDLLSSMPMCFKRSRAGRSKSCSTPTFFDADNRGSFPRAVPLVGARFGSAAPQLRGVGRCQLARYHYRAALRRRIRPGGRHGLQNRCDRGSRSGGFDSPPPPLLAVMQGQSWMGRALRQTSL